MSSHPIIIQSSQQCGLATLLLILILDILTPVIRILILLIPLTLILSIVIVLLNA